MLPCVVHLMRCCCRRVCARQRVSTLTLSLGTVVRVFVCVCLSAFPDRTRTSGNAKYFKELPDADETDSLVVSIDVALSSGAAVTEQV
jgi:hypothetical protein